MSLDILNKLWDVNEVTAKAYKSGYSDCEKKYKKLEQQYEIMQCQLKKLGYEIGEKPDILKSASLITKYCKSNVDCNRCEFHVNKCDICILSGENPSAWKIN